MKIEIWNEGKVKYRRDSLNDDVVIEALNQPNYTVLKDGKKLSLSGVSGWKNYDKEEPSTEGRYLCCNRFDYSIVGEGIHHVMYVSNFNFYRLRTTGELNPDSEGRKGCFSDDGGYSQHPNYWMPLPESPTE